MTRFIDPKAKGVFRVSGEDGKAEVETLWTHNLGSRIEGAIADLYYRPMETKRSRVDDSDYGLGIWHRWYGVPTANGTQRVDTIMLSGNGGQKVYIVPSLDLVAVFTGGAFNVESPVNTLMAHVLLPALLGF